MKLIKENTPGIEDEIHDLPGLSSKLNFRQYSGYLNASGERKLHYWFVESQSNPIKDPVILWLNGGPGCSSLFGFFTENGPFRVTNDSKNLTLDQFSWNTVANVIYLEMPSGVGFSYDESNCASFPTNDSQTAKDSYLALLHFFDKFPQFIENDFYIAGQSYAGVYIPLLSLEILRDRSRIHLKGLAIGNGSFNKNIKLKARLQMAYNHGLIDTEMWNQFTGNCCSCVGHKQFCNTSGEVSQLCFESINTAGEVMYYSGINPYNIYDQCYYSPNYTFASHSNFHEFSELKNFHQNEYFEGEDCYDRTFIDYLNDPIVRKAIHIAENLTEFKVCNNVFKWAYERTDDVRKEFVEILIDYKLDSLIIYSGDSDLVCPLIGNQIFVDELDLPVIEKYKKWTYDGLTAGFVKRYNGLTFVSFRDAGHSVPTDKPGPALHLIKTMLGKAKLV
jgi:cathepsin A (carboxypeptidase C)